GLPGTLRFPLWFVEGMAEYLSVGAADPHTAMWMRDAVNEGKLPTIQKLEDSQYFPYRWGQAFWAYVGGTYGDEVIGKILKAAGQAGSAENAIAGALPISLEQLSQDWLESLKKNYEPELQATKPVATQFRLLLGDNKNSDNLYVSPSISPDGKNVVFFSEKGSFSIDLFLADGETGKIRRKLTQTALDPHFDSLQFINSAGSWSFDGKKFAFAGVRNGRPEISIYEIATNRIVRRFPIPATADIFSTSWSPDGSSMTFSALANGQIDLFVLDLERGQARRLTDDCYAELHPAWSPDGKTIAVSTDRFTSDPSRLSFGDLQIALLDVASLKWRPLPGSGTGKHLQPQWSADGSSLYFISDRNGISNIYRFSFSDGELKQITDLQTGVSGISKWSPAYSLATGAGRMVFSVFAKANYALYVIEGAEALAGVPPRAATLHAGVLPPPQRSGQMLEAFLRTPEKGMVGSEDFKTEPYRASLSLDYVAPPSVGVGISNFGSMIGGGIAFYWSDLLGYHNLMTAFQTSTTLEGGKFYNSLAGVASYENQKTRWNWGFVGGQIPYLTSGYGSSFGTIQGRPVILEESVTYWEISRQIAAILAKPFNRAQRIEFSAGFQNISYDAVAEVDAYSAITGEFLGRQEFTPEVAEAVNLATANAALVYDTSVFGGTSPVLGQRYRFEIGAAGGSLRFATLLADYRRYVKIAGPLSLAGRILHYGRYGSGASDERLMPLFIGYPTLVHGYDTDSFSVSECISEDLTCPVYDQLFGERMIVVNLELRFPPFGLLGGRRLYGPLPIDFALFVDAGVAWTGDVKPKVFGGERDFVRSIGVAARVNVLGFVVVEAAYVNPLDRPGKNPFWQFGFAPSF
ncbi:MAG: peptidase S9, partial [candidate division WOR-3 bacterium]